MILRRCNKLFLLFFITISIHGQSKLFVNQVGYLPSGNKIVVTNTPADSFYIINSTSNIKVYSGSFEESFPNDDLSGMNLKVGNFSNFTQEGNFKILSNLNESSFPFVISDTVYSSVYKYSQKAFYFQRCGMNLVPQYAGSYHHLACHTRDAFFHESSEGTGFKYSIGGWHDAGDFGKYIVNAGITLGTMMLAYELYPEYFSTDQLNIPESGNGVPDLLDEIRSELEWELKMQDSTGGVFTKLTRKQFSAFVMPEDDSETRYIYQISSAATADFAAAMAKASRIFNGYDSNFSTVCKNAALNAWTFLEQNPSIVPSGGFINPDDTGTGEYGDTNDKDERLWAAAELYVTTTDDKFDNYYLNNFNSIGLLNDMSWQSVASMAHITYLLLAPNPNALTITILSNSLNSFVNQIKSKIDANGFGIPLNNGEFYWGSNSSVLNDAIFMVVQNYFTQTNDNDNYINRTLDYVLGVNPNNKSFVSGIGTNRLMHPHHRQSEVDNIEEPVPGLLAGGPNQYLNDAVLSSLFDENTPPALCYIDTVASYASNEIAINWNAPLVFVAGYLNGKGTISDVNVSDNAIKPNGIFLYQNYPNPFNPSTNIKFKINESSRVKLEVFDSLGGKVTTLVDKRISAGTYTYPFDLGAKMNKAANASGVYFYKLTVNNYSISKKMVFLK